MNINVVETAVVFAGAVTDHLPWITSVNSSLSPLNGIKSRAGISTSPYSFHHHFCDTASYCASNERTIGAYWYEEIGCKSEWVL